MTQSQYRPACHVLILLSTGLPSYSSVQACMSRPHTPQYRPACHVLILLSTGLHVMPSYSNHTPRTSSMRHKRTGCCPTLNLSDFSSTDAHPTTGCATLWTSIAPFSGSTVASTSPTPLCPRGRYKNSSLPASSSNFHAMHVVLHVCVLLYW